jgi:ABC-type sugar transport system ATPase subunit
MIRVENLYKQFDKRGIAGVHSLSFSLEKGHVMAIMGPNGSGKTTLLKILAGEAKAEGGSFTLGGKVSLFPDADQLDDQNVQKFLVSAVTLDIDDEKKIQLARDLADTFEFTFQLRQKLSELSSGQKQKILLAKKLINRPALFLMDEPFAHLDPFTRKDILKGLFSYIKDQMMTVLWVTHDLEEAFQFSDFIGLMNFGKFEQLATPLEMVKNPKNLFVAKFMGYRNFFSVKFENNEWATPWGALKLASSEALERLLVVPDHAWIIGEGIEVKVVERHAGKQMTEYVVEFEDRKFHLVLGSQLPYLDIGTKTRITPDVSESFHITH